MKRAVQYRRWLIVALALNLAAIVFCVNVIASSRNLSICATRKNTFPFVSPHTFAKNFPWGEIKFIGTDLETHFPITAGEHPL